MGLILQICKNKEPTSHYVTDLGTHLGSLEGGVKQTELSLKFSGVLYSFRGGKTYLCPKEEYWVPVSQLKAISVASSVKTLVTGLLEKACSTSIIPDGEILVKFCFSFSLQDTNQLELLTSSVCFFSFCDWLGPMVEGALTWWMHFLGSWDDVLVWSGLCERDDPLIPKSVNQVVCVSFFTSMLKVPLLTCSRALVYPGSLICSSKFQLFH